MGVFLTMNAQTKGMIKAANMSGVYVHPANGQRFRRFRSLPCKNFSTENGPKMPMSLTPYFQAQRRYEDNQQPSMFYDG